jgi:hypothetical protein
MKDTCQAECSTAYSRRTKSVRPVAPVRRATELRTDGGVDRSGLEECLLDGNLITNVPPVSYCSHTAKMYVYAIYICMYVHYVTKVCEPRRRCYVSNVIPFGTTQRIQTAPLEIGTGG